MIQKEIDFKIAKTLIDALCITFCEYYPNEYYLCDLLRQELKSDGSEGGLDLYKKLDKKYHKAR